VPTIVVNFWQKTLAEKSRTFASCKLTTVGRDVMIPLALTPGIRPNDETVGQRLRRLRLEQGLSQRELSDLGVSYAYISRIEASARRPSVKALRMLARKLGVSAEYLETGSEISATGQRELQLADAELGLRLDNTEIQVDEIESILRESDALGDAVTATRARITLGLVAARRGDHTEAISQLEQAIASDIVDAASRPDVYATLGRIHAATGNPRQAVELFERGLADLERLAPNDSASRVRFSTYLSYALTDMGNLGRAQEVVEDALRHADENADPYTRVRLYWSLGRIAYEQDRPLVALEHFRRAVALLEATEDTLHLARGYLSVAAAVLESGQDPQESARLVENAERLLGASSEPGDLAVVRWLQALLATRTGKHADGARYARESLALADGIPNQHALAAIALAEALAGAGDPAAGETFVGAITELEAHGTVRELAEALRSYGRYLRTVNRESEALDVLDRAATVATGLQPEPSTIER
jgi:transcriptional regulator with XRE-family HTH domain